MLNFFHDTRYAWRQLRKNPGFALTAIVILGLGIGATTAIFSAVNPILFEPLPYPQANRIMMIWYGGDDGVRIPQTFHTYRELAERNRAFESMAVMQPWQPALTGAAQPERLDGQQVSAGYFRTLGVAPAMGRDFLAADDLPHGPRVVILSHSSWRAHFGGDRAILGSAVKLNDDNYTVVGVMPSSFNNVLAPPAEFWTPLQYDSGNIVSQQTREWGHHLRMVGRMRADVSVAQAKGDLQQIARTRVADFPRPPWASMEKGMVVNTLRDDIASGVKPALLAVLGAVILVLLIACVNVTNLLLARGAQRRGEFAMRADDRAGGAESSGAAASGCDSAGWDCACVCVRDYGGCRNRAGDDSGATCFARRFADGSATEFHANGGWPAVDAAYLGGRGSGNCAGVVGKRGIAAAQLVETLFD